MSSLLTTTFYRESGDAGRRLLSSGGRSCYNTRVDEERTSPSPTITKRPISAGSRRLMWRGFYTPFLIAVILAVAAGAAISSGGAGGLRIWADAAAIFLLAPLLLLGVLAAVMVFLLAAGVSWLTGWVPGVAHAANQLLQRVAQIVNNVADILIKPFRVLKGFSASLQAVGRIIRELFLS